MLFTIYPYPFNKGEKEMSKTRRLITGIFISAMALSSGIAADGDPYTWPSYNPGADYDFRTSGKTVSMPTKDLDDCSSSYFKGTVDSAWWTFRYGSSKNSLVATDAIHNLLAKMNKDFAYFRDSMGWPPDSRAQAGYRSAVYLYGSGLCTDDASNTETGGWQSEVGGYPIVLLSYYPVYCFDASCTYSDKTDQQNACVHEGIHCILASMDGCKEACWFQEGGNTWLQQEAYARQNKTYSDMGFLNGAAFLAPFMPIECYSGWLQDGTFGGPCAEGVNKYSGTTQLCTWRNFLGGVQYSNIFPVFLANVLGQGSIPFIWKYCTGTVLEGLADTLGETQIRRLIMEYRAKQALIDFKKWSDACQVVLDNYFGTSIVPEGDADNMTNYVTNCATWKASCYAKTKKANDTLIPLDTTLPGWSGGNQIPLKITSGSTLASVDFRPIGKNMKCQLCYRATDGSAIYGSPVDSGTCSLRLDKSPANSVIFAVVCNTDYVFTKDTSIRTMKYDYRLRLVSGIKDTAYIYTRWYNVTRIDDTTEAGSTPVARNTAFTADKTEDMQASINHGTIDVKYKVTSRSTVAISLYSPSGTLIRTFNIGTKDAGYYKDRVNISSCKISSGSYIVAVRTKSGIVSRKISALTDK
jgi:hypothetical protein